MPHALLAEEVAPPDRRTLIPLTLILLALLALLGAVAGCGPTTDAARLTPVVVVAPPSASSSPPAESSHHETVVKPAAPKPISWQRDAANARQRSRQQRRPLLVFVHADWAAASTHIDRTVWTDDRVRRATRTMVLLRVDVSDTSDPQSEHLAAELGVEVIPTLLLLSGRGRELARLEGRHTSDEVLAMLMASR